MASILIFSYIFVTGVDGRRASNVHRVGEADKWLINVPTGVLTFPDS